MSKLFEETKLKNMNLKNRFFRSATWEAMADEKGHLTDKLVKVYQDLAQGGVGTIITGYAFVTEDEQPNPGMMGIYDDSFTEEYQEFTDQIHQFETNIIMQLAYGGSQTNFKVEDRTILGPSAVPHATYGVSPKKATKAEIKSLINSFAEAALRAKKSGFDGVQFHAAHGYLYSQFLSPHYNQRTDEYGGSIENRGRIIFETLAAVIEKVGEDFPVMIKLNSSDFKDDGFTFADCKYICKRLDELGIDAIEISGVVGAKKEDITIREKGLSYLKEESYFRKYAAEIAAEVEVPIILVGGNRSPQLLENLLEETEIEYFSLARPFLREPGLINRWKNGDKTKAKCISCGQCRAEAGNSCIFKRKK
ncbi:2,4-dienoyl-CoA reductase-like NADH-dependent reductase (Old Yellow Enzyme family) [Halanaerobium saccharolyticum]|uniref:2,4-dienoyl-CoA reductase-like NADH-dependent reductase (Old Yellow Enzyme family) n=1 Tax=Halanaerobium saccharolyticum TaxID=43595 RepID=A0A4R6RRP9_9FIRM|nr:NADH:flavin oxidoreductase [Halanaerobium saccharolyticum]TDP89442.1 2,4-dienoyl-CoA reductase-like NADH-dependent reductase (Old Yellow Enzyme family) [Halanaerobium saccharolyticum]